MIASSLLFGKAFYDGNQICYNLKPCTFFGLKHCFGLNYLSKQFFNFSHNAPFAHKNYFNVLDVAKAVVMPLSEGHLAKTELTCLK